MQVRGWTEHDDSVLSRRYNTVEGHVLATEMGRSLSSLRQRACVLGLGRPRTMVPEHEHFMLAYRYRALGLRFTDIAELLGVTASAVCMRFKRHPDPLPARYIGAQRQRLLAHLEAAKGLAVKHNTHVVDVLEMLRKAAIESRRA